MNHALHLFVGHHLTDGKTEDFMMDAFGDWKGKATPLLISLLFVGRYRIVNECLYALIGQMALQFVAMLTPHGEKVKYMA